MLPGKINPQSPVQAATLRDDFLIDEANMVMTHKCKEPKRGKKRHYYSSSPFWLCFAHFGLCFAHDTKAERDAYVKAQQRKGETLVRAVTREHAFRHGLKWPGEKKYVMFIDGRALYIDGYVLPSAEMRRKS